MFNIVYERQSVKALTSNKRIRKSTIDAKVSVIMSQEMTPNRLPSPSNQRSLSKRETKVVDNTEVIHDTSDVEMSVKISQQLTPNPFR